METLARTFLALGMAVLMASPCLVSAQQPGPDPEPICFVRINLRLGCADCGGEYYCHTCTNGQCVGQRKLCQVKADLTFRTYGAAQAQVVNKACYVFYGCKPESTGPCGPDNLCTTDFDDVQGRSPTTFKDYELTGTCIPV